MTDNTRSASLPARDATYVLGPPSFGRRTVHAVVCSHPGQQLLQHVGELTATGIVLVLDEDPPAPEWRAASLESFDMRNALIGRETIVENMADEDVFTLDDGITWHVCGVVLFGTVSVYIDDRRDDDSDCLMRIDADRDQLCVVLLSAPDLPDGDGRLPVGGSNDRHLPRGGPRTGQPVVGTNRVPERYHARLPVMYIAKLETANFTFTAAGFTHEHALAVMRQAWTAHAAQTGATYEWHELVDGVNVVSYRAGYARRDYELMHFSNEDTAVPASYLDSPAHQWVLDSHCADDPHSVLANLISRQYERRHGRVNRVAVENGVRRTGLALHLAEILAHDSYDPPPYVVERFNALLIQFAFAPVPPSDELTIILLGACGLFNRGLGSAAQCLDTSMIWYYG